MMPVDLGTPRRIQTVRTYFTAGPAQGSSASSRITVIRASTYTVWTELLSTRALARSQIKRNIYICVLSKHAVETLAPALSRSSI